ncbi:hypothetical protein ARSEF4850_008522 [Beauveria asiatica]
MPPHSPNHPVHDLFPFSPSTPTSTSGNNNNNNNNSNNARQEEDRPVPPGAMVQYLWTCHACGCGTFRCNDASVALCIQCGHQVCDGCTTFFGARLLRCVEVEHLLTHHAANPGCTCEQCSRMSRCRASGHPIRRCPANSGLRRLRHTPYAHPTLVQHCIVTFRPGRDGSPALGTFFALRPRFDRPRTRTTTRAASKTTTTTTTTTTMDCIARSVAAARPTATIPPIYDMLRQPRPDDPTLAPRPGISVSTVALARFFATGAASVARTLGLSGRPVVCVRVDPMLAFVAYYLCASFCVVFAEWRRNKKMMSVRQPPRAAPE